MTTLLLKRSLELKSIMAKENYRRVSVKTLTWKNKNVETLSNYLKLLKIFKNLIQLHGLVRV